MIELAPNHKFGLPIKTPLMPAGGFYGYSPESYKGIINPAAWGAMVTNPITLRPRRHQTEALALETNGGLILSAPPHNPGVRRVIKANEKGWRRAEIPLIAHLPADAPEDLARTAGALDGLEIFHGFELVLPANTSPLEASRLIQAIHQRAELPLLVKLPHNPNPALTESVVQAGADALVISATPPATGLGADKRFIGGTFYGPGLVPQLIPQLIALRSQYPDVPLIASGGIHALADGQAYLAAGAKAVQVDSLIFVNPRRVQQILAAFQ